MSSLIGSSIEVYEDNSLTSELTISISDALIREYTVPSLSDLHKKQLSLKVHCLAVYDDEWGEYSLALDNDKYICPFSKGESPPRDGFDYIYLISNGCGDKVILRWTDEGYIYKEILSLNPNGLSDSFEELGDIIYLIRDETPCIYDYLDALDLPWITPLRTTEARKILAKFKEGT